MTNERMTPFSSGSQYMDEYKDSWGITVREGGYGGIYFGTVRTRRDLEAFMRIIGVE